MTDWTRRAADAVAGFTSTRSRGPEAMFGGPGGPTHMTAASGARVTLADGRVLLDWTMSLGSASLGYGHPAVVEAAVRAARDGVTGPLPPTLEVTLAERLGFVYPGAEQARFLKTGAEGVAAAVRLARAATGRETVLHCGYHGWLDGPTRGAGVPASTAALWLELPFNDCEALAAACSKSAPAAIVLEPVIERAPDPAWLALARDTADRTGAALIMDEIKTAFRIARGGAAERWKVRPDLAVLGKSLSNGFPLAAVVGRSDLMARVRETWISSTQATEAVSLAAAHAVLDVWDREDVAGHIRRVGALARERLSERVGPFEVCGLEEMFFLRFADEDAERRLLLGAARKGVLIKRGAYNYPSLAHTESDVSATVDAVRAVMAEEGW